MTLQRHVQFLKLLLAVALGSTTHSHANDGDYIADDIGAEVCEYVDLIHKRLGFSGVVLAGRDGKVVAAIPRGFAGESDKSPLRLTSLFEIASCTKPFTAIATLQLAESGKLSLDDSIAEHLPNVPVNCRGITIRHLLSHTSGIPGTNTNGSGDDIADVVPKFLADGPKHKPGENYEYWNQGYALLSEIVARASGSSYTQYVHDHIFGPCQMPASRFTGDEAPVGSSVAVGRSSRGASRSALEHPYGSYGFQYRGMGGLVTNVQDLWKWDRALQSNQLISQKSLTEMTTSDTGGYGLGWFVQTDLDGKPSHRHGGSVRGFLSEIRRYPSLDGALFVLSNSDDSLPITVVQTGVEQILFGKRANLVIPQTPDRRLLARVEGEYRDAKGRRLVIASSGGLPSLKIYWGGPVTVGYLGLDDSAVPQLYMTKPIQGTIRFVADGALEFAPRTGKAESVSLLGLTPKLTFRRTSR